MFAAVAVAVILWLYWSDARDVLAGRGGGARLAGAAAAVAIIGGVAGAATWKVHHQSKAIPSIQPALDPSVLSKAVKDALKSEESQTAPSTRPSIETRVIVDHRIGTLPSSLEIRSSPAKPVAAPLTSPELMKSIARMRRQSLAWKAERPCLDQKYQLERGLASLISAAATKQNVYYDTKNAKAMTTALNEWLPQARKYLEDNKAELPDTSAFELANIGDTNTGIFPRPGYKAWAIMDAKRKALEVLLKLVDERKCDDVGKAAVVDCEANEMCDVGPS